METFEGYYDYEATEREKFMALDGVGETTATKLVERYEAVSLAAKHLLGNPRAYPPEIRKDRVTTIRNSLEKAGYEPPCDCESWEDVKNSQTRDDCLTHCRTCESVIAEGKA